MAKKKSNYVVYHGQPIHFRDVAKKNGVAVSTIYRRRRAGWSDERIVETPQYCGREPKEKEIVTETVEVLFREPIGNVFESMQPKLNQVYVAVRTAEVGSGDRPFYIITLDSGKRLIVYPEEFTKIGGEQRG